MEDTNIFQQTKTAVLKIAHDFNLDLAKVEEFIEPNKIIEVKLKAGNKTFKGFRSQHNNNLGPYKGGIRFHHNVSREEVMALSLWMSLKTAIAGLPYGGGKGGIIVNPKTLSEKELEELSRDYARKIADDIGPHIDVPAPDVNTNPKIMEWMVEEFVDYHKKKKTVANKHELFATFTGKPNTHKGLAGREEATGFGGVVILSQIVEKLGKKPKDLTVAIQGFGNVGYFFALFASEMGFNVVAVSDSKGGIIKNKGESYTPLDIPLVMECKKEKGSLSGCYCAGGVCDIKGGKMITNEELLELPVDILVPAALESVITPENMHNIRAKIIIEMANGPVHNNAYEYLSSKEVIIAPDVLANAGGVTGSYLEWKQNLENKIYKKDYTLAEIKKIMIKAFNDIWDESRSMEITLKEAAYTTALKKILG